MSDLNIMEREYWGGGGRVEWMYVHLARLLAHVKEAAQISLLNRRLWKWLVERIWLVLVELSSLQNFSRHFYTKQGMALLWQ
jgi:hypothetical protein